MTNLDRSRLHSILESTPVARRAVARWALATDAQRVPLEISDAHDLSATFKLINQHAVSIVVP